MKNKTDMRLLQTSLFCFGAMSASFLLMAPWSPEWEARQGIATFSGILFWVSLLIGTVLQITVSSKWKRVYRREKEKTGRSRPVGMFRFFSGKAGKIADGGLIAGVLGLVLSIWLTRGIGIICYVFLFVMVFFFTAHCIFNGRNYYYITHIESKKRKPGRYAAR